MKMLVVAMVMVAAAMPGWAAQQGAQSPQAANAYAQGEEYLKHNDYAHALAAYDRAIQLDAKQPEFYLEKCRALAGLQRYPEAVAACGQAIQLRPEYVEALRDQGHFYINMGQYAPALADLKKAESMDRGDRIIYYHLGLAYYLTGDFKDAAKAFEGCVRTAKEQDGILECTAWLYPSLRRSGQEAAAKQALGKIDANWKVQGHAVYYFDRLMLFKGAKTVAQVEPEMKQEGALSQATVGYGIGLYELLNGDKAKARDFFRQAVASGATAAFGYRAAEQELKRMK